MQKLNFKKDMLPHLVAIFVFAMVTVVFFAPAIFEGKVLPQHDVMQGESGSRELTKYRNDTGEEGLWSSSMFAGMPGYLLDVRYSGELTKYVHHAFGLFLQHPYSLIFISFLSCYIMLLAFGVRSWLAIAGGLAFGLTEFSIIGLNAGHNSKIAAVAIMPLVLAGIQMTFNKKWLLGFAVTALALAMELRVNHLQITYYLLLMVLIFGFSKLVVAIKSKTLPDFAKILGVLVVAACLAVGANVGKMWSVLEYSKYSTRGKSELTSVGTAKSGLDRDYAFQYSNGIFEPLVLFIPNFFGGASQQDLGKNSNLENALKANGANRQQIGQQVQSAPAYWGDQPATAPYYAGAIVVFLFVLGLIVLPGAQKWWVLTIVVLGIVLSWGSNFGFNNWMFDYFPGYNKFRSVTFVIIISVLAMILGGFTGLEKFLSSEEKGTEKKFWMALGIAGGFALLCVLFAGMGGYVGAVDARLASYPEWFLGALRADRASLLRMDALRSLIFILLFGAAIWFLIKKKYSTIGIYAVMIALVMIDMFGVSKRFINSDSFQRKARANNFELTAADQVILKDPALNYKVLNLINPFNDAKTSYHHKSLGGYHGAKMGRYQDLIERCITPEQNQVITALQAGSLDFGTTNVINMLNAKYFIAGESANAVIPNAGANGNAWFVQEVAKVNSADEEIVTLNGLNTKQKAVVDQSKFSISTTDMSAHGTVELKEYKPNYLKYTSTNTGAGIAIFSEIYYPVGWNATIDGKEIDIFRANYVLRGLEVPAGDHVIEFKFEPAAYHTGNTLTWIANVLLLLVFLFAVGKSLMTSGNDETLEVA